MYLKRITNIFVLLSTLLSITYAQVTIDGYAYLENQTDHSGIKVHFERTAPSTLLDLTYTDASGYFSIQLEIGVYNVTYSKEGYLNSYLYDHSLFSNTTLTDVTLLEHVTLINVPADYPTIQSAINISLSGDTVLIAPGTYFENINFQEMEIIVASLFFITGDTNYITQTIIDGSQSGSVVTFDNNSSMLNGLTITNGLAYNGGGIYCNESDPILMNLKIIDNTSTSNGGGIYCQYSSPILNNVTVKSNNSTYDSGGGIFCRNFSNANLNNVILTNNVSGNYGGAIYCSVQSNLTLTNVIITGNSAYSGGGIYCASYSLDFMNVTISNNIATTNGGGIYFYQSNSNIRNCIVSDNTGNYGIYAIESFPTISFTNFWNNAAGNFYNVGNWVGINVTTNTNGDSCDLYNNIQLDPLFVNPSTGDYHLQAGSPSIDAGDPNLPLDPDSTISDQGAYYYDQSTIPTISSVPDTIAIEDSLYSYQLSAAGIPSPTFSLLVYPEGMTIDNTGLISWLPNNNDVGDTIVSCTAINNLGSDTQTFNLHINNINDPPSIITTGLDDAIEDQTYNFTIQATDDDVIHGDNISYSLSVSPVGMTINNNTGEIIWSPDNDDVGDTTVTVTVTDDSIATDSKTFSVSVRNTNDAPFVANQLQDIVVSEDADNTVIALNSVFSDDDIELAGDSLVINISNDNVSLIAVSLEGFTLTLSYLADQNGIANIIVMATDDSSASVADTFMVTVNAINDPPGIVLPDSFAFNEDDLLTVDFTPYFNDIDSDTSLILTVTGNIFIDVVIDTFLVTFTGETNWSGFEDIVFTIDDQNLRLTDNDTIRVSVSAVNDAPVITALDSVTISEDNSLVVNLSATDIEGDDLTYSATSSDTNVMASVSNDTLTLIPDADWNGTASITVTVADEFLSDTTSLVLTVTPMNDPPSAVTLISPDSIVVVSLLPEFRWSAAIDPDIGDSIHYELHWVMENDDFVDSVLTDTNYAVPYAPLDDNSKFFWWVISMDRQYDSNHSEETVFWIDVTPEPPLAFNTVSPPDSAEGLSTEVSFVWNKTNDPDPLDNVSYTLVYAADYADSNTFEYVQTNGDTTASTTLTNDMEYFWWVMANDEDGLYTLSNNGSVNRIVVGTLSIEDELLPDVFALHQNYPNPFNPVTTLRYDLPENSFVNITIYDLLGRKVTTLVTETQDAGFKSVIWNATNDYGKPVSAGVYLYKIQAGKFVQTKKMVLLK